MTTNPGKAEWAARKAAELDRQLAELPQGWSRRDRAKTAQAALRLLSEAARYRAMAARWAPDVAA